ncbi:cytochrome P450 [Phanerochaete sordida]|uniref:Cytochrome P450 n=1 Tax=Phanerochaete sordida TaxID=48140 RepID=A0A9P3GQE9_9APHY|nr:cytochrome P450 [Phanerochaete sordida]
MDLHPRHYRTRFLLDVLRALVWPQLVFNAALYAAGWRPGLAWRVLLSVLSVPALGVARSAITQRRNAAQAASLGAKPIPCVRGKWPGNLDIVLGFVRSLKEAYLMQFLDDLFREYGCKTLNMRILWEDQIWTIDEAHMKYMLAGPGFDWFHKGYYWQERMESFLGNGIFNRDGAEWQSQRAIARPWFAKDRLSDLNIFDRHTSTTLALISEFAAKGEAFDAQDLFARFTLDSASEFLFGKCLETLHGTLPVAGRAKMGPKGTASEDSFGTFAWAFEDVQMQISRRTRIGKPWPLFELFRDKTAPSVAIVQDWLRPIVREALERKAAAAAGKDDGAEGTFLSHLTNSTDDPQDIAYSVLNMLLAGRDTTASVLSFMVYFLALHPEVTAKLRAEILQAYGPDGRPSVDDMKDLKYLRAVLNETMRLFPPVPMNLRLSDSNPHAFPASANTPKYYVPPRTVIIYSVLLIQRRKDLWGADALDFRPERWLEPETAQLLAENPFAFTPFHAGPRLCLGQNFAYNEMSFFAVRLLQRVAHFELAPDAQPAGSLPPPEWKTREGRQAMERIWPASSVTTFIKGGLWVRAVPA